MIRALSLLLVCIVACTPAPSTPPTSPTSPTSPTTTSSSTSPATSPTTAAPATLRFVRDGQTVTTLDVAGLIAASPAEVFTAFDPYYQRDKTFRAVALGPVLAKAFSTTTAALADLDFVLRAKDGYTVPFRGRVLLEEGSAIAIADVDVAGWEPIGQQKANPGPFYVVWKKPEQANLDTHPRPWQLATIEIASFDSTFPHTVPSSSSSSSSAQKGFTLFRTTCIACHAINREGGRIGPDLNVPQSIVEYRPAAQIRAYIKDPRTFRYSTMPAHPHFSDDDLDALLAYFTAMKDHKHDPDAAPSTTTPTTTTPTPPTPTPTTPTP